MGVDTLQNSCTWASCACVNFFSSRAWEIRFFSSLGTLSSEQHQIRVSQTSGIAEAEAVCIWMRTMSLLCLPIQLGCIFASANRLVLTTPICIRNRIGSGWMRLGGSRCPLIAGTITTYTCGWYRLDRPAAEPARSSDHIWAAVQAFNQSACLKTQTRTWLTAWSEDDAAAVGLFLRMTTSPQSCPCKFMVFRQLGQTPETTILMHTLCLLVICRLSERIGVLCSA